MCVCVCLTQVLLQYPGEHWVSVRDELTFPSFAVLLYVTNTQSSNTAEIMIMTTDRHIQHIHFTDWSFSFHKQNPSLKHLTISARAEMTFPSVVRDLLILAPSWRTDGQTVFVWDSDGNAESSLRMSTSVSVPLISRLWLQMNPLARCPPNPPDSPYWPTHARETREQHTHTHTFKSL